MSLVNVALGRKAFQSSLSPYSRPDEANDAVSGVFAATFAFHTDEQIDPWWYVDLGRALPIYSIVVHNRADCCQDRAYRCSIQVSDDLQSWIPIHNGFALFGCNKSSNPLICLIGGLKSARYVKISIDGLAILHLSQVEIFSDTRHLLCESVRSKYNLPNIHLKDDFLSKKSFGVTYDVVGGDELLRGAPIKALKLVRIGRLGNQIRQLTNAIAFAKRHYIPFVEIVNSGLIDLRDPLEVGSVTLLPEGYKAETPCLVGDFYYEFLDLAPALNNFDGLERYRIVSNLKSKALFAKMTDISDDKKPNELTVHMRAGDLFDRPNPNPGYIQPPLAFYTKVLTKLFGEGQIQRLRIVYEDLGNPCVAALEEFAVRAGIEVRMTSGSLESDLAALVDSERLMFGVGTFGTAVCLLSEKIKELYFFKTIHDAGFANMPSVAKPIAVVDMSNGYIQTGYWENTEAQREIMLNYSESNLEIFPV